jgi:hypothetical protein
MAVVNGETRSQLLPGFTLLSQLEKAPVHPGVQTFDGLVAFETALKSLSCRCSGQQYDSQQESASLHRVS